MKIHLAQNVLNLKAVKEPAEKTLLDLIKPDPKAFKTVLITASEEELAVLKGTYVGKNAVENETGSEDGKKKKNNASASIKPQEDEKKKDGEETELTPAFYSAALTGAVNAAIAPQKVPGTVKTGRQSTSTSLEIPEAPDSELKTTPANSNRSKPAGIETAAVKTQEEVQPEQETATSKTGMVVTSISITASRTKDNNSKPDDMAGQNRDDFFTPRQMASAANAKQADFQTELNADKSQGAQEIIKTIGSQLKASFEKPPEKGVEYTAVIKLSPPSLGAMEIRTVLKDDNTVSVKITASKQDTITLLTTNSNTLKNELSGVFQGSAGGLDVSVGSRQQQDAFSQNFNGAGRQNNAEQTVYQESAYAHRAPAAAHNIPAYAEKNAYLV
jgi:hypothetical protein